jgi:hypothetical protein
MRLSPERPGRPFQLPALHLQEAAHLRQHRGQPLPFTAEFEMPRPFFPADLFDAAKVVALVDKI